MKQRFFVDLIDGKVTTGKVHPFYKGFRSEKQALKFSQQLVKTLEIEKYK